MSQEEGGGSFMNRAQNAVAQKIEQLTADYIKDLESLAKLYQNSGDLLAKGATDEELARIRQNGRMITANSSQIPAGIVALQKNYYRRLGEETIRALHPLIAQQRDEIAKRKKEGDFASAMIMEKELNAVRERFGWKTETITPDAQNFRQPAPKYPLAARKEHIRGTGSFLLEIDTISGAVTQVIVSKSTGHAILDAAAISALQKWHFPPHHAVEVEVPITFKMNLPSRAASPTTRKKSD